MARLDHRGSMLNCGNGEPSFLTGSTSEGTGHYRRSISMADHRVVGIANSCDVLIPFNWICARDGNRVETTWRLGDPSMDSFGLLCRRGSSRFVFSICSGNGPYTTASQQPSLAGSRHIACSFCSNRWPAVCFNNHAPHAASMDLVRARREPLSLDRNGLSR